MPRGCREILKGLKKADVRVVSGVSDTYIGPIMESVRKDSFFRAVPVCCEEESVAVARPKKSVVVIEGDGGLIMEMETLISVGAKAPPNLLVITFYNNCYVSAGGQALPADMINLEDFAKAARFPQTATVDTPDGFEAALDGMLDSGKLGFINLLTASEPGEDPGGDIRPRPLENRANFKRWISENCP